MRKIIFIVLCVMALFTFKEVGAIAEEEEVLVMDETYIGADFSSGIYSYQLTKKFDKDPKTIETWVRLGELPNDQAGGVIFSNYEYYNSSAIKMSVNKNREIEFTWNNGQVNIVFSEYYLPVDEWVHLAIVIDDNNSCFNLYVNGIKNQSVSSFTGTTSLSDFKFIIGGDWSNWRVCKNPFQGEIAQVTVYSKALKAKQVYEDYLYGDSINSDNRTDLLFNGKLAFECEGVIDTSINENHAKLRSNDYYFKDDLYKAKDYTIAVIPDPQVMAKWKQDNLYTISDYIINYNNQNGGKVPMTICVGDNADGISSDRLDLDFDFQLKTMKEVYDRLYNAGIGWITTPGNHDYDDECAMTRNLAYYNKYFSYDEISKFDYFGGAYKVGQTQNAYYLFEACGVPYLVISVEFGADNDVLDWANKVVSSYPNCRVIVDTHTYIGGDGEIIGRGKPHAASTYPWVNYVQINDPVEMYEKFISQHENIFMVLSGHVPSDDILVKESVGKHGNKIIQLLIDAQGVLASGSESILSMITFDELNQTIGINYVSTTNKKLYNVQNQFEYSFKGYTNILSSVYYDEEGNLKPEYR